MKSSGQATHHGSATLTRTVGAFTQLPSLIRDAGGDPAAIFADADLQQSTLDSPTNRISYDSLLQVLQLTAERTSCKHFGLLAGAGWRIADLGVLGEIMRNSPNLGEALHELVLHQHVNADGTLAVMLQRGVMIDLGYAAYSDFHSGLRHMYDAVMAAATSFMRELCGPGWSPAMVLLQHSAPPETDAYRRFFRAPVHFDQEYSALRFHSSMLQHPIEGADAGARRVATARLKDLGSATFADASRRSLRALLMAGRASGADLAGSLAIHRRTLNRRLEVEGLTFQDVLDEVRLSLARELLLDSELTTGDIALALGFQEQAAFFRAFRRWTGTTPGRLRQALKQQAGSGGN
jgi:AraC-like DNA-binding protein